MMYVTKVSVCVCVCECVCVCVCACTCVFDYMLREWMGERERERESGYKKRLTSTLNIIISWRTKQETKVPITSELE